MGIFSWLDCNNEDQILAGIHTPVYVLIPKDFGGGHYIETLYEGYGIFDGNDIFDLVASWNKEYLSEDMLMPAPSIDNFGGLWNYEKDELRKSGKTDQEIENLDQAAKLEHYNNAIARRNKSIERMMDYKSGCPDMAKKYGKDWQREIGIDIACYDEQNLALPYPIKITYDENSVYENCKPSLSDPNQGCI